MNPASLRNIELGAPPGFAPYACGAAGQAHNEAAFRHFLGIEVRRAQRAGQAVVLVLVSMRASEGRTATLSAATAAAVFAALGASVRDVDFVGWFRESRVAAATLIQSTTPNGDIRQRIASRVSEGLRARLRDTETLLRVRVATLRGRAE